MHFYDHDHVKKASIKLVAYCHDGKPFDWRICSILECKHISIDTLTELGYTFKYKHESALRTLKKETFYLVKLSYGCNSSTGNLFIDSVSEITESEMNKNPLLGLH
jgi:hypothetical protein